MGNINDAFPSNYLKASDLRGGEPVVTIDRVAFEPVGRQREMKAVLYFAGKDKGLVLNKTNATKISNLVGSPETDEWAGMRIKLYPTETEFAGESVECIRIKAAPANGSRQATPPPPPSKPQPPADWKPETDENDDDIPF